MPKFQIDHTDYNLSQSFGKQMLAGSAFAFINPSAEQAQFEVMVYDCQ